MSGNKGKSKGTGMVSSNDASYIAWISELKRRYRATQIKAAIAVNSALIEFYWNLGRDIAERYAQSRLGNEFYRQLSNDLKSDNPNASGLSPTNLKYSGYFYRLYSHLASSQQLADSENKAGQQVADSANGIEISRLVGKLVCVPWGHHMLIIDKCRGDCDKALFYIRRTIQNGWSRNVLLNWISSDLYECEGKAQTNFELTMPSPDSDLARQLVKDPQNFEVFGLGEKYSETELKSAIVANIESALLSFGKGIAFLGREYPVEIGGETKNIDLLFYIVPLHRYLVVEVKTGKYEPADLGQLSGYIVMVKHALNTPGDNQPVGLLICREHNRVLAKYHLEEIGMPMGITDYELKKVLPTQAQLAKCIADAERRVAKSKKADVSGRKLLKGQE